jgi:hypothetical protein
MSALSRSLTTLAIAAVGLGLHAEDFNAVMDVARQTWPEKTRIGIVCDYSKNQEAIQQLAMAAGSGTTLLVMDTRHISEVPMAQHRLQQRKTDFVVLLPNDRIIRDGSFDATMLVGRMAIKGIPTIATTPIALKQGAVFSIGDGTHGQLMVCDHPTGTVSVILPQKGEIIRRAVRTAAKIEVLEARS